MRLITKEFEAGVPVTDIAEKYQISPGSVLKKVHKTQRARKPLTTRTKVSSKSPHTGARTWDPVKIKSGIDEFIAKHGVMPTSSDFINSNHLPSARQIQRTYGGLSNLRKQLGYKEHDFTKGKLRKEIAREGNMRGLTAEDAFEPILISKFGEPFVHVQKRYYKGSKNRYDFFVYAKNHTFGVDVFTTKRLEYVTNNVRHKISRYKHAPRDF